MKTATSREVIHIRIAPELKAAIVALAARDGFMSVNEWIRTQLQAVVKKAQK